MARRLRRDLPFRRIAVVLSGGGALGGYEVGVLKALEQLGLRPAIVSGASAGALNAVAWVAQGFRAGGLEAAWKQMRPGTIGMRLSALAWRAVGGFLLVLGVIELLVTWIGSAELSVPAFYLRRPVAQIGVPSAILDLLAWAVVAGAGLLMLRSSRGAEALLSRFSDPRTGKRARAWGAALLAAWAAIHLIAWIFALPWPHRFSATLLLLALTAWLANRPGRLGHLIRRAFLGLLPETKARGIWGGAARRRLVRRLAASGDPARLVARDLHLIVSGLALDNGRITYFVNWPDPSPAFRERVESVLGETVPVTSPDEVLEAAVASSAIPVIFEPGRVKDREYIDPLAISMHPLRAALYDDADAVLVIVVAPSGAPPAETPTRDPIAIWGRFLDLANWRDLQEEMRALPPSWKGDALPRRLCIVEPDRALPGGVLDYAPAEAERLIALGEEDAWKALERAGWVESSTTEGKSASDRRSDAMRG
ncbi:MAG: patatin-like phospholipase family protein [Hyphomicrobiales bacterium]